MSSAGHVLDMINRVKQNMALKANRRKRYNKVKEIYLNEFDTHQKENNLTNQNISEEELFAIKSKIKTKLIAEKRRNVIISIIIIVLVGSFLIYLFTTFYNHNLDYLKY